MSRPDDSSPEPRGWAPRPQYPTPPPPPPGTPSRGRRRWPWVLLGLLILLLGGCTALFAVFAHQVSEEAGRPAKITYAATGKATGVTISYSSWRDGNVSTSQVGGQNLPWTKVITTKGFVKGGSLIVTLGADGGAATCSVTVDDAPPITASAMGPFASAVCNGF
ncbi:hypothetical protein OHS33_13045 [Streptomyces sp. NBC_00536]|uniref:hypothetical protein n=1 Tax=Streptomyces sp. NBC_00536 TaxID=2975769 RepID=UPI002E80446C|nr:hypothetical protein [Streptomyces sp. NBC_00536]WUC79184.1 hypothetical protein OHS33_13045 [Streptomyces sp. NBC_00536]